MEMVILINETSDKAESKRIEFCSCGEKDEAEFLNDLEVERRKIYRKYWSMNNKWKSVNSQDQLTINLLYNRMFR